MRPTFLCFYQTPTAWAGFGPRGGFDVECADFNTQVTALYRFVQHFAGLGVDMSAFAAGARVN